MSRMYGLGDRVLVRGWHPVNTGVITELHYENDNPSSWSEYEVKLDDGEYFDFQEYELSLIAESPLYPELPKTRDKTMSAEGYKVNGNFTVEAYDLTILELHGLAEALNAAARAFTVSTADTWNDENRDPKVVVDLVEVEALN